MRLDRCSHGKTWVEECLECEAVWLRGTIASFEPMVTKAKERLKEVEREKIGGARNGAGLAPDTDGQKTAKHTVTLDIATVALMKELGNGNLSRGIREAARRLAANATGKGRA